MASDICLAPDCGALIKDDSKPCPVCHGLGFRPVMLDGKQRRPWTNAQWVAWMRRQADAFSPES